MQVEYSIQLGDKRGEGNIETQELISELLSEHPDAVQQNQPTGALGVGEVLMVVIAVNSTLDLAITIGEKLHEIRSETEAIVRIEHPEKVAIDYISEYAGVDKDELELRSRHDDGEKIQFEFVDSSGRTHTVSLNPFDPDLNNLEYEQE